MLVFAIPLKSARAADSWDRVTNLVRRTVRSACAQDCGEFRVVLCCHEIPDLGIDDDRVVVLPASFDPPGDDETSRRRDKRRKLLAGLQWARDQGPCHVMPLDADDCVSRRLAAHVAASPDANGWYIARGFFYQEGRKTVHVARDYHQWCGSSNLLRSELLDLPTGPVDNWNLPHRRTVRQMRERGTPLRRLPFPGGVYIVSHGDNFRDYGPIFWPSSPLRAVARRLVFQRRLTAAIREEFGLYPLDL